MTEKVRHNHVTRDIKPYGRCPACDEYHGDEQAWCPECRVAPGQPHKMGCRSSA